MGAGLQAAHYAAVGKRREHPSFCGDQLGEAQDWLDRNLKPVLAARMPGGIPETLVSSVFWGMHECAAGLDGHSKRKLQHFISALLSPVTLLFCHLYETGACVEAWCVAVIVSIRKKGVDLHDLNNYRGIHLLAFLQQWYSGCLGRMLDYESKGCISPSQQGFVNKGMCELATLGLWSLIERARASSGNTGSIRLYSVFIDIAKAFPSVCRALLWFRLSRLGISLKLIRAIFMLYVNTKACVRGEEGFSALFTIDEGTREGQRLSPRLYILFKADLEDHLRKVVLTSPPPIVGSVMCLSISFADDVVLSAHSVADIEALLESFVSYAGVSREIISVPKTIAVIFREGSDTGVRIMDGHAAVRIEGRRLMRLLGLQVYGEYVPFATSFPHLGTSLHETGDLGSAWEARDGSGQKALGATRAALRCVDGLPASQVCSLAQCLAGEVYLAGAAVWGAFVPAGGSDFDRELTAWLLGLPVGERRGRAHAWFPVRNHDAEAVARACRVVIDCAELHPFGRAALEQLYVNQMTSGAAGGCTWLGRVLRFIRTIWQGFGLSIAGELHCTGIPGQVRREVEESRTSWGAPRFRGAGDVFRRLMQERGLLTVACACARSPPTRFQQDYLLARTLRRLLPVGLWTALEAGAPHPDARLPFAHVFPVIPACRLDHLRTMARFLSGKTDFARVHAHYSRLADFPELRSAGLRRACLFCIVDYKCVMLDSEWHFLFGCPSGAAFLARLSIFLPSTPQVPSESSLDQLVDLLLKLRPDECRLADFARGLWWALHLRDRGIRALPSLRLRQAAGILGRLGAGGLSAAEVSSLYVRSRARIEGELADSLIDDAIGSVAVGTG